MSRNPTGFCSFLLFQLPLTYSILLKSKAHRSIVLAASVALGRAIDMIATSVEVNTSDSNIFFTLIRFLAFIQDQIAFVRRMQSRKDATEVEIYFQSGKVRGDSILVLRWSAKHWGIWSSGSPISRSGFDIKFGAFGAHQ